MDEVDFSPADKQKSLQGDNVNVGLFSQACPKYPKQQVFNIFAISPEKHWGEVGFLPADKRESFLQGDSIALGVDSQHAQNDKFAISLQYIKENMNDEVDFLPADKCQRLLLIDTIIWGVCRQACPNYPK